MVFYVQTDAARVIRTALRAAPFMQGVRVVAETLAQSVDAGVYVTVTGDGTPHGSRATSTENVRINVYAKLEPDARDYARVIDGYLHDPRLNLGVKVTPGANLLVVADPDTGGFVAAVTVLVASTKKGYNL